MSAKRSAKKKHNASSLLEEDEVNNSNARNETKHTVISITNNSSFASRTEEAAEAGEMDQEARFRASCHLAVGVGVDAMEYGSTAGRVESFLREAMQKCGYSGVFYATRTTLFCNFHASPSVQDDDAATIVRMRVFKSQFSMTKLGLLADLANKVIQQEISIRDAEDQLDEIRKTPNPWGVIYVAFTHVSSSAGMAIVLNGSWWDVILSSIAGLVVFLTKKVFERIHIKKEYLLDLIQSFLCAILATGSKIRQPDVNVVIVTLSGVYVSIPGYKVSLGTAEIVTNHILSGLSRIFSGIIVLIWLFIGGWCGVALVDAIANSTTFSADSTSAAEVPTVWHALFVPLLCLSMIPRYQIAKRDVFGSLLCMGFAYGTSYGFTFINYTDLGILLSAVVMTCFANIWARIVNRPNTIVLTPAFTLQAAGSIGFRGIINILNDEGDTDQGVDQFLRMFQVALLLVVGIFVGNSLIPAGTTL